jgi:hypothetical protein
LKKEFKILLIRTYAGALAQVTDQTIVVRPLRAAPTDNEVVVRSEIRGRGEPVQLDYRLEKTPGQGAGWRIFNLNVLGVWLVDTYRSQFSAEINARGIDGLINTLAERNNHPLHIATCAYFTALNPLGEREQKRKLVANRIESFELLPAKARGGTNAPAHLWEDMAFLKTCLPPD